MHRHHFVSLAAVLLVTAAVQAQPAHVIIPQSRGYALSAAHDQAIRVTEVQATIDILEATATTTLEIHIRNHTGRRQEAQLLLPVPEGAVVRGFSYDGPHGPLTAQVLPKDEARRIYRNLVSHIKDPALVEFIGYQLIQSNVFPVEPHGKQRLRLTYEHLLTTAGPRLDYVLPRTESLAYAVPWHIHATVSSKHGIATVYSPSHTLSENREGLSKVKVKIDTTPQSNPGPFRLSILLQKQDVTASLFTYPDAKVGGGYFLLLAGLPPKSTNQTATQKREVTLVIDRSGSMRNEKIAQVKEAALQIIAGLQNGEAFNIILYSNTVELFARRPVIKSRRTERAAEQYLQGVTATGGTNIHDALQTALNQPVTSDMLPICLFLTDGLPTVGQTAEKAITDLATQANVHKRRVFTIGVGLDVNGPLLRALAERSRARATFILPQEDVEVKIGHVFASLQGPVLSTPRLTLLDDQGQPAPGRTRDILPAQLPDLFEGDRLVLLGQYVGQAPITFQLEGDSLGKTQQFRFAFQLDQADVRNGFVPRLWASRKIAELIDLIRQAGASPDTPSTDPKIKELTDEIVRLSTEFGILTEYTAFLAREGTDLRRRDRIYYEVSQNLESRARRERSGKRGINQSLNLDRQRSQVVLNSRNSYLSPEMEEKQEMRIQQINDLAFYQRGNQWLDSRLIHRSDLTPTRTVSFGSEAYLDLAEQLARSGRHGSLLFTTDILLLLDNDIILVKR
ncbi:VWA domain-containing protein [Planctomycetota bacterium]